MKAAGKDVKIYAVGTGKAIQSQEATALLNRLTGNPAQVYNAADYQDVPDAFYNIASQLAGTSAKSSVVYFVLDAAPPLQENDVMLVRYAAINLLDTLSKHVNLAVPTPVTKILAIPEKPQVSTEIDDTSTIVGWTVFLGVVLSIVLAAGLVGLAGNSDTSGTY